MAVKQRLPVAYTCDDELFMNVILGRFLVKKCIEVGLFEVIIVKVTKK